MSEKVPNLARIHGVMGVLAGLMWGPLVALLSGNELDAALWVASACFGLFFGVTMFFNTRRMVKAKGAEALQLHCQRTLAVAGSPASVFQALREHLEGASEYELEEASAEFHHLRARRKAFGTFMGEDVAIHLVAQGEGTAVRIDSHSASPLQQLDQGANQRNVEELAGVLIDHFPVDTELARREQRVAQAAAHRVPEG